MLQMSMNHPVELLLENFDMVKVVGQRQMFFHNIYASRSAAFAKFHKFSREKVSNSTFLLLKPFGTGSQLAFKDF